jgi:hypothetical protein
MRTTALQEHLRKMGKSIRGTALDLGIEPHLLNAYANGKRPNQRNALKVAAGLGVDVRALWPNFDELRPY